MGSFQAGMLVEQVNVTTTTGGTTTLVAATSISATLGKQNQIFTGSLGETIVLPDATTMIVGQSFNIFNQSSSALTIEFNGGGAFTDASLKSYTTLSANTSLEITLQDNTSGGTPTNVQGKWAVIASSSAGLAAAGTKNYLTAIQTSNGTNTGNGNFEFGNLTGWQWCNVGALTNGLPTGTPNFTGVNANSLYIFTISTSTTCAAGDTYTNNGQTFTVVTALSAQSGAVFYATGTGAPSSGSLSRATGSGTSSITFSSWSVSALSTVSSGQLSGSYSASLALANLNAGLGFASSTFYIDTEDQAKVLTYKLYYNVHSGASNLNLSGTSANNLAVAVYDVTNSVYLGVAGAFNFVQASGTGYATGTVQTGATTTQLAFIVYNPANQAGSATVYFDDIFVGPQTAPMGPAMTDWVAYTPTFVGFGNPVTGINFHSRRVGDSLEVQGSFTTGTPTATANQISIGYGGANSNVTIDSTKTGGGLVGYAGGNQYSTTIFSWAVIAPTTNQSYVQMGVQTSTTSSLPQSQNGSSVSTTGTVYEVEFKVPIVGWSSNTSMSSDTDTRVAAVKVASTGSQTISSASFTKLTILGPGSAQVVDDTHGGWTTSTNSYTIPVTGYWDFALTGTIPADNTHSKYLSIDTGVTGNAGVGGFTQPPSAAAQYPMYTGTTFLNAGTVVSVSAAIDSGGSLAFTSFNLSMVRRSGPAVVAATESVNARYTFAAGGTNVPNASPTNLSSTYATYTKVKDTHNGFNTATGVYTVPVSGSYRASLRVSFNPTTANSGSYNAQITQAGSATTTSNSGNVFGTVANYVATQVTDTFNCLAGDTLTLSTYQSNSTNTLPFIGGTAWNSFSIERVGQ